MSYRLTATEKWDDAWFISLKRNEKLIFYYLCDNCDIAGFFELSLKKFRDNLGFTDEETKEALIGIKKVYVLSRKKEILFLKNFIKHQKNVPLNHRNNAHIGIFKRFAEYKSKFDHDLIKIANKGERPKQNKAGIEGLQSSLYNDKDNGIDFIEYWNLYDKKVGDKKLCEKKWNLLKPSIQKKIMEILPKWKKLTFTEKQHQPYPETFLNQERWNDELSENQQLPANAKFPGFFNKKYHDGLNGSELTDYWKHLRTLGYVSKKDHQGNVVEWIKPN